MQIAPRQGARRTPRLRMIVPALMAAAMLAAPISVGFAAVPGGKGGEVKWQTDAKKGMKLAKKNGMGMMLYFTSDG